MRKSATNRVFAGVCGGIAESTGLPSILVRACFFVGAFFGLASVILYVFLAVVMDPPAAPIHTEVLSL